MLAGAALASRTAEAMLAGKAAAAVVQGVLAILAFGACRALWVRFKAEADEQVLREMRSGRRDAKGTLRENPEDDGVGGA